MRLLVFGASGRCGSWVVRLAAQRGHDVRAVIRPGSRWRPPPGVEVLQGEPLEPSLLDRALGDREVVVSALGLRRAGLSPWARLTSPPDLVQRMARLLAGRLSSFGVGRLIWVSAGGVGDSRPALTAPVRALVEAGNVGVAYRDLEAAEAVLSDPSVPSLAVRPVTLVGGRPRGRAAPVARYGVLSTVRRADVAQWMLDVAEREAAYPGRSVLLGTGRPRPAAT